MNKAEIRKVAAGDKQIPMSMDNLREKVIMVQESALCLIQKISPVLRPSEPAPGETLKAIVGGSQAELASVLDEIAGQLWSVKNALDDACERVEL